MKRFIERSQATAILGLITLIIPFTGFPSVFRTLVIVLASGFVIIFSYLNYRTVKSAMTRTDA